MTLKEISPGYKDLPDPFSAVHLGAVLLCLALTSVCALGLFICSKYVRYMQQVYRPYGLIFLCMVAQKRKIQNARGPIFRRFLAMP